MRNETIIRDLPTVEEFKRKVDRVIHGDMSDGQIRDFMELIMTPANAEDDRAYELAKEAARHAFAKTDAFQTAFEVFMEPVHAVPVGSGRFQVIAKVQ